MSVGSSRRCDVFIVASTDVAMALTPLVVGVLAAFVAYDR